MAVSYPLNSPVSYGWSSVRWGPMTNTAATKTPFTLEDVVQVYEGEMWAGALSIVPQTGADARGLAAWITSLRGRKGTFLLGDPAAAAPLGSAKDTPGAPVVDGAGQTGESLDLRGLPAGATGYLLAGDHLQLGSGSTARLHMVLAQVDSDGAGKATVPIFPRLGSSPADGASVTLTDPQGVFRLARGFNPWEVRPPLIMDGVSLDIAQVVP